MKCMIFANLLFFTVAKEKRLVLPGNTVVVLFHFYFYFTILNRQYQGVKIIS